MERRSFNTIYRQELAYILDRPKDKSSIFILFNINKDLVIYSQRELIGILDLGDKENNHWSLKYNLFVQIRMFTTEYFISG